MKKFLTLGLILLLSSALLVGCNTSDEPAKDGTKVYEIGITQIAEHSALDASRQGFIGALKDAGYVDGENIKLDYQNAQNSRDVLTTISQKFVADKKDLILAIATRSAQSIAQQTTTIPILITAVTDPVQVELVDSIEKPGGNVTGTTDLNDVKAQLSLVKEIAPDAKVVGIIYNTGEPNSEVQVKIAQSLATELGLTFELAGITNTSEVKQAADSLASKVDVFYVPTDNTVVSSLDSILMVAESAKIPVISGESDSVRNGALITYGLDYYALGYQTGEMAVRILKGESVPADMPIESQKDTKLTINLGAAERMGVVISQELIDRADDIIE